MKWRRAVASLGFLAVLLVPSSMGGGLTIDSDGTIFDGSVLRRHFTLEANETTRGYTAYDEFEACLEMPTTSRDATGTTNAGVSISYTCDQTYANRSAVPDVIQVTPARPPGASCGAAPYCLAGAFGIAIFGYWTGSISVEFRTVEGAILDVHPFLLGISGYGIVTGQAHAGIPHDYVLSVQIHDGYGQLLAEKARLVEVGSTPTTGYVAQSAETTRVGDQFFFIGLGSVTPRQPFCMKSFAALHVIDDVRNSATSVSTPMYAIHTGFSTNVADWLRVYSTDTCLTLVDSKAYVELVPPPSGSEPSTDWPYLTNRVVPQ